MAVLELGAQRTNLWYVESVARNSGVAKRDSRPDRGAYEMSPIEQNEIALLGAQRLAIPLHFWVSSADDPFHVIEGRAEAA